MSMQEIETAIRQLPPQELARLIAWLSDYHQEAWERQIEDDLDQGRLDRALDEVEREYQAGLAKPL